MPNWRTALSTTLIFTCLAVSLPAQNITLSSNWGDLSVSGRFLGFDGSYFRVDTEHGEVTVPAKTVTCAGDCPVTKEFVANIVVSGAESLGTILFPALVEGFAAQNRLIFRTKTAAPGTREIELFETTGEKLVARFTLNLSSTEEGIADLLANETDFVLARREFNASELKLLSDAGFGNLDQPRYKHIIGREGFVPIVAPGNAAKGISTSEIVQLLNGQIDSWAGLGLGDTPITINVLTPGTDMGQSFFALIGEIPQSLPTSIVQHRSMTDLVKAVVDDPKAIGFAHLADSATAQVLDITGPCRFSVDASHTTLKTQDYPLTGGLYVYRPVRRLSAIALDFLSYLNGRSAQLIIRRAGFVDQIAERIPIQAQGRRFAQAISAAGSDVTLQELQRMSSTLSNKVRLTPTFRFEQGSNKLDAHSQINLAILIRHLEDGEFIGRRLNFVGFSDGDGPAETNGNISLRRAEAVRDQVLNGADATALERVTLNVDAFGEAMPMLCDDEALGRRTNRRVEVWLD